MSDRILSQRVVQKTRKEHRCQACGSMVAARATMQVTTAAGDDSIYRCYWCPACVLFLSKLDPSDLDDGFNYDIQEHDGYEEFIEAFVLDYPTYVKFMKVAI